jgi:hypothetical protein
MNQLGTVAGIQVMQTVQAATARGRVGAAALLPSFHLAYVVGGAVALLGVAAAAVTRSTNRRQAPTVDIGEALEMGERQPVLSRGAP